MEGRNHFLWFVCEAVRERERERYCIHYFTEGGLSDSIRRLVCEWY